MLYASTIKSKNVNKFYIKLPIYNNYFIFVYPSFTYTLYYIIYPYYLFTDIIWDYGPYFSMIEYNLVISGLISI